MKSALERFWDKVDKSSDGCWRWVASLNESGYGQFFVGAKRWRAHRFAYTMEVGEIPAGFELDHLCRNRACVNPSHLEPVSRRENQRRGTGPTSRNIDAEWCVNGHPFNDENTRIELRKSGEQRRACRACDRDRKRAAYRQEATS